MTGCQLKNVEMPQQQKKALTVNKKISIHITFKIIHVVLFEVKLRKIAELPFTMFPVLAVLCVLLVL